MARDYYADGFEVAERLREDGAQEWAERVDTAIDEGFTASEILMGLRHELTQLLETDLKIRDSTRALAEDLVRAINSALSS